MKIQKGSLAAFFVLLLGWGTTAYAGCTNEQFAGTWDVAFSDGNVCNLIIDSEGNVLTSSDNSLSTCFDPFRGTTAPDSGSVAVADECLANIVLVVEGAEIQMGARIAKTRDIGAGIYVIPIVPVKGSFTMIRAK